MVKITTRKKKASAKAKKKKTNPKGISLPSLQKPKKTPVKKRVVARKSGEGTTSIIIVNGKSVSKKKSEAAKKSWITRRKNAKK